MAAANGRPVVLIDPRIVAVLRTLTFQQVQDYYHSGYYGIGQVEWEAFCYAWRRGAPRMSSVAAGTEHPVDDQVRQLGNAILGDRSPGLCPCPAGPACTR
jgi:hypothetical protein